MQVSYRKLYRDNGWTRNRAKPPIYRVGMNDYRVRAEVIAGSMGDLKTSYYHQQLYRT